MEYGQLKVIGSSVKPRTTSGRYVLCKCKCGSVKEYNEGNLKSGHTKSCGCFFRGHNHALATHLETRTRFYRLWAGMLYRCRKNHKHYEHVSVCLRWTKYQHFRSDMYSSYLAHCELFGESETTIDRRDSRKGYSLSNCRWATYADQARNTRTNRYIEHNGLTLCIVDWIAKLGIAKSTVYYRLDKGMTAKEALGLRDA